MPATIPCPNPNCGQMFAAESIQGTGKLACPRCGTVFLFRPATAPTPATPTPPPPPAIPTAQPVRRAAPPVPQKPAPIPVAQPVRPVPPPVPTVNRAPATPARVPPPL